MMFSAMNTWQHKQQQQQQQQPVWLACCSSGLHLLQMHHMMKVAVQMLNTG
jgi:hypothetical protein